jgi:hypothetical protein
LLSLRQLIKVAWNVFRTRSPAVIIYIPCVHLLVFHHRQVLAFEIISCVLLFLLKLTFGGHCHLVIIHPNFNFPHFLLDHEVNILYSKQRTRKACVEQYLWVYSFDPLFVPANIVCSCVCACVWCACRFIGMPKVYIVYLLHTYFVRAVQSRWDM